MTDMIIPSPAGDLEAYLAVPSGSGPFPGVVVIHDAFGLSNDIRNQADWLASDGFLAIAPNLFRGRRQIACMVAMMRDIRARQGQTFVDIEASRAWLAQRDDCTGTIGVIGFCMGGGLALILAPQGQYAASSVNYGTADAAAYDVRTLRTSCPIVGSYGGRDRSLKGAAQRLETALNQVDVEHDIKEYPGAGHAFLNDRIASGDPDPLLLAIMAPFMAGGHQADEAADARRRIVAFFDKHLRPVE